MENSLHTVQTFVKIAKVVALILFIIICICVLMVLIGIFTVPAITSLFQTALESFDLSILGDFADVTGELANNYSVLLERGILDKFITVALAFAFISIAAVGVVSFLAYYWFKRELKDGTPFTHRFAADMKRLGIIMLVVDLGLPIILSIAGVIALPTDGIQLKYAISSLDGLIFIVIGAILKYGACLADKAETLRLAAESVGNTPETPADDGENSAE